MEEEGAKKTELVLDWEELLPSQDDDPPDVLIVKPTTTTTTQPLTQSTMGSAQRLHSERDEGFDRVSDHELNELIRRKRRTLETMSSRLNDGGEKVRTALKRLEDEMERRKLRRVDKEADVCEKPTQSTSLSTTGVSNGFIEETASSQAHSQSAFASCFRRKMEESTYCGTTGAFDKELSVLSRCDSRKMTHKGELSQKERRKGRLPRQRCSQCPSNISKHVLLNSNKKGRASTYSLRQSGENLSSCCTEKMLFKSFILIVQGLRRSGPLFL